jgi:hypothetical protein
VAAVVVAAGVDAAADVQVDVAEVVDLVEIGKRSVISAASGSERALARRRSRRRGRRSCR